MVYDVSQAWYIVELHHSGWEPSNYDGGDDDGDEVDDDVMMIKIMMALQFSKDFTFFSLAK